MQRPLIQKHVSSKRSLGSLLVLFALFSLGCTQSGSLLSEPEQRMLKNAVDAAFDSQIDKEAISEYYPPARAGDIYCTHQQAHLDKKLFASNLTVCAKVVCAGYSPGFRDDSDLPEAFIEAYKDLSNLISVPIKIEVQPSENSFTVMSWQLPSNRPFCVADESCTDLPKISSKVRRKIDAVGTDQETNDRIREAIRDRQSE